VDIAKEAQPWQLGIPLTVNFFRAIQRCLIRITKETDMFLALGEAEWSASRSGRFTPFERTPYTLQIGARLAPELFRWLWSRKDLAGNGTPDVHIVVHCYTNVVVSRLLLKLAHSLLQANNIPVSSAEFIRTPECVFLSAYSCDVAAAAAEDEEENKRASSVQGERGRWEDMSSLATCFAQTSFGRIQIDRLGWNIVHLCGSSCEDK
jgi:hypothetical protein